MTEPFALTARRVFDGDAWHDEAALVIGDGLVEAVLPAAALPADLRADLLIQTARVALQLGDQATARAHYERFIREFPKDRRHYTIRQALAHLGEPFPP